MVTRTLSIWLAVMVLMSVQLTSGSGSVAHAQAGSWTADLPHPDAVNWSNPDRPGYRYRGMTPDQQRFYEHVQGKRLRGEPLTGVEVLMIRTLQAARRWPEPPRPNAVARAYLQHLREIPPDQLTFAQRLMIAQMRAQGLIPHDADLGPDIRRLTEYLGNDSFRARNWFERNFGRVGSWMRLVAASQGLDMRGPVTPGVLESPRVPGVQIRYSLAGATLTHQPTEASLRQYEGTPVFEMTDGVPQPGQVVVTATVTASDKHEVRFRGWLFNYAGLMEEWAPGRWRTRSVDDEVEFTLKPGESRQITLSTPTLPQFEPDNPNLYGHISITLRTNCTEVSAWHRHRLTEGNPLVAFHLKPCPTAAAAWADEDARRRADAAWRAQVERTLQELGQEQTPEGREVAQMRAALARGEGTWQEYVDRSRRHLAAQEGAPERELDTLMASLEAGDLPDVGPLVVQTPPTPQPPQPPATPPPPSAPAARPAGRLPDVGGLTVGTGQANGRTTGAAEHFDHAGTITGVMRFTDLSQGSKAVGIWSRDGAEITRSEQTVGGTGWMSFSLRTSDPGGLRPGAYTLTIMVGNTVLGRKTFTIGAGVG